MFNFHSDKPSYFQYQYLSTRNYIIPFLEKHFELQPEQKILEIGSAEAGVLKAFTERGHECTGIELQSSRVDLAKKFMQEEVENKQIHFIESNIFDIDPINDLPYRYDLIILKDVIEHIPNQEVFADKLKEFLNDNGRVFFAFPPWQMPFGGHQQMCKSKILSVMPYYHLLPMSLYSFILKLFKEPSKKITNLMEIKGTGISIERFERIMRKNHYYIEGRQHYLFNPIYKYKYKLNPVKQSPIISGIPYFRNFLTTGAYYLARKN